MLTVISKKIGSLSTVRDVVFMIGVKTKIEVDKTTILRGLGNLMNKLTDLTESNYDDDEEAFILKNDALKIQNQKYLRIDKNKIFRFMWGSQMINNFQEDIEHLLKIFESEFDLVPINIDYIDYGVNASFLWTGNTYQMIYDLFYSKNSLYNLFEKDEILEDDIYLRGRIDGKRIVIIRLDSNQRDSEIFSKSFSENRIRTVCSFALTKVPTSENINECFIEHINISNNFIENKFIPNIVNPLHTRLLTK